MGLKLNATNGGGSVELDVPDTVNSDLALTVPAAAGTIDRLERAGNILQVVQRSFRITGAQATNTAFSSTPEGIIDNYQTEIEVTQADSKIFVMMSIHLLGQRLGPANAGATIGFDSSTTSGDSKSASDYSQLTTGGSSNIQNCLYVSRRNISSSDLNAVTGYSSTGSMTFLHTHGQSVGTHLYYTALTCTGYSNASASYIYNDQSNFNTVTLMEVAA